MKFRTKLKQNFANYNRPSQRYFETVAWLEGCYRRGEEVDRNRFEDDDAVKIFLRRWRNDSSWERPGKLTSTYDGDIKNGLRNLTVFQTLEVPLFIDDYGTKQLLGDYDESQLSITGS